MKARTRSTESNLINHGSRTIRGRMDMLHIQVKSKFTKVSVNAFATIVVTHWVNKSRYSCLQGSWVGSTDSSRKEKKENLFYGSTHESRY